MAVRDPLDAPAARDQLSSGASAAPGLHRPAAEAILGHVFARPDLLTEALTHRSAAHGNRTLRRHERRGVGSNERLEFIGDRVLGLIIAEWLIERYPEEQEGELGRRYARLVSRPVLAGIAERLGLGAALALAPNETRAGVGALANTLADAMEAAVGALFLDAGLEVPRRFVRAAWAGEMDTQIKPPKDAKTELQEWLMARGQPLPVYETVSATGPSHAPAFVLRVAGAGKSGTGTAGSKREAERLAAQDLLEKLTS